MCYGKHFKGYKHLFKNLNILQKADFNNMFVIYILVVDKSKIIHYKAALESLENNLENLNSRTKYTRRLL